MFLIDTDVLSALRRRERNPAVADWISSRRTPAPERSVHRGGREGHRSEAQPRPAFAGALAAWLDSVTSLYRERILGIDLATARRLRAERHDGRRIQNFTSSLPARARPPHARLRPGPRVAASPRIPGQRFPPALEQTLRLHLSHMVGHGRDDREGKQARYRATMLCNDHFFTGLDLAQVGDPGHLEPRDGRDLHDHLDLPEHLTLRVDRRRCRRHLLLPSVVEVRSFQ